MAIGGKLTPEQTVEAPVQGVSSRVKKKRQNIVSDEAQDASKSLSGFVERMDETFSEVSNPSYGK